MKIVFELHILCYQFLKNNLALISMQDYEIIIFLDLYTTFLFSSYFVQIYFIFVKNGVHFLLPTDEHYFQRYDIS